MRLDDFDSAGASMLLAEISRDAHALVEPGARGAPVTERRIAYMRYVGQGHEITVPLPVRDLDADDATTLRENFEREYWVLFRRPIPGAAIEVRLVGAHFEQAERPRCETGAPEQRTPSPDGSRSFFEAGGQTVEVRFTGASAWTRACAFAARRSSPTRRRRLFS